MTAVFCTACDLQSYYSYRAEKGRTGRMLALLGLRLGAIDLNRLMEGAALFGALKFGTRPVFAGLRRGGGACPSNQKI